MKTKKINLASFNKSLLIARLFVITKNFESIKGDLLIRGRSVFMKQVEKIVSDNFIYPEGKFNNVCNNLALFLLNNPNNTFDKTLKL